MTCPNAHCQRQRTSPPGARYRGSIRSPPVLARPSGTLGRIVSTAPWAPWLRATLGRPVANSTDPDRRRSLLKAAATRVAPASSARRLRPHSSHPGPPPTDLDTVVDRTRRRHQQIVSVAGPGGRDLPYERLEEHEVVPLGELPPFSASTAFMSFSMHCWAWKQTASWFGRDVAAGSR